MSEEYVASDVTDSALRWITRLLTRHDIPHLAVGGFAARAYGATRPLYDIDLYVPSRRLGWIAELAAPYVTRPPARHVGAHWDIVFMQLDYDGQLIELGGSGDVRIRDARTGGWIEQRVDYGSARVLEIHGIRVPVMDREELVAYKRILDRPVDRWDLHELRAATGEDGALG